LLPTLEKVAPGRVQELPKITGAEDFSFYANKVPGLFVILGVTPPDQLEGSAANHSPRFYVDESALVTGMKTMATLAADYLTAPAAKR
jgi:amidohydrolase